MGFSLQKGINMGFSCYIKGKNGEDILKKYNIQHQLFDIAPTFGDRFHVLAEIREVFSRNKYGEYCREAAMDIFTTARKMVLENIRNLSPNHCKNCHCPCKEPEGWDKEMAIRFCNIDENEIERVWGGW